MASVPPPMDFLSGLGGLANLPRPYDMQQRVIGDQQQNRGNEQALQAGALQLNAAQAQQQQAQQYQTDVKAALDHPTAANFSALSAKYPEHAAALKQSWDAQDAPTKQANLTQLGNVFSYISNGKPDLAAKSLQSRIDAEKAAGLDTTDDEQMLGLLTSGDPKDLTAVNGIAGMHLASALGPEKYAQTLKDLGVVTGDTEGKVVGSSIGHYEGNKFVVDYSAPDKGELREIKVTDPVTGQETTQFVRIGGSGGGGPVSSGGAPSGSGGAPLSVRTNNPGAIRFDPNNQWQGQVGNEGGFVKFDTPANGARAHQKLIANQIKNGFDTPLAWTQHYAPAADGNDPQAYAQTVAQALGIGVNDKIPLSAVPKLAAASAGVEAGGTPSPQGTPSTPGVVASYVTKPAGGAGSAAFGIPENLQGAAVIQALPPNIARQVQGLLDGRQQLSARQASSPYGQQLIAAANQADPNYDTVNYNARAGVRKSFTSGADAKNVTSLGTAINHMGELYDAFQKLNNGSIPALNWLGNHMTNGPLYNKGTVQAFNANVNAVADELETTFRGSSGTLAGTESWKDAFGAAASPEAFKEVLHKAYSLLQGRADELGEKYSRGMGTTREGLDLLSPVAKRNAALLSGLGPKASGETPTSSSAQPVHVATRAQAMALPSGTHFIDPSGKMRVRP